MAVLVKGTTLEQTYEIVEEIGSGGGGIVYRARHLRLQTDVVVKKIKDEMLGKVKSRQEADILKKLKHPYLPRVYDFIEREDGVYTVMDFIHGESLDSAIKKNGKFSQKQVKKWAEQLGEVLAYLHSQTPPIIHSDIKPANIMLTEGANICLIDFNVSLAMGGSMESAVGVSAGYSPPEQYRDPALYAMATHNYNNQEIPDEVSDDDATEILHLDSDATNIIKKTKKETVRIADKTVCEYTYYIGKGIDSRSDIYSLGMTLYYLLSGIAPSIDFGKRISIKNSNITISEGFAFILNKMISISPDERYQDGIEYLKAIRNCYKLDHRYIIMHRWQNGLQAASMICFGVGILAIFGGIYQIRKEANGDYFEYIQKAQEAMKLCEYDEADEFIAEAKGIFSTRIEAYREEVYNLYLSGSYEKCISLAENYNNTMPFLIESEEDEACLGDICYIAGNSYFELEDYQNAIHMFEYALNHNGENGLYYRDMAIALARIGQTESAVQYLEQGIEIGISQDAVYMTQGEIAHMDGQYQEAIKCLNHTMEITTDTVMKKRAVLLCADTYKAIGNTAIDEEIALLEQYIDQLQGNGDFTIKEYLAEAYSRKAQNDKEQADVYWEKALSLFLSLYEQGYVTYQLQENIAILYENMDLFEEAKETLLQMADRYPERYEIYKRLAFLEADWQQMKDSADRNYAQMQIYHEKAKEKYPEKTQDMEMNMLDNMIQELKDGGWL